MCIVSGLFVSSSSTRFCYSRRVRKATDYLHLTIYTRRFTAVLAIRYHEYLANQYYSYSRATFQ
jgi:hypothetical protein